MSMGDPYTVCFLNWAAKYATSHVLQSNKNKIYRGRCDCLSVSIGKGEDCASVLHVGTRRWGLPINNLQLFWQQCNEKRRKCFMAGNSYEMVMGSDTLAREHSLTS